MHALSGAEIPILVAKSLQNIGHVTTLLQKETGTRNPWFIGPVAQFLTNGNILA